MQFTARLRRPYPGVAKPRRGTRRSRRARLLDDETRRGQRAPRRANPEALRQGASHSRAEMGVAATGESFDANALEPSIGSSAKPEPASLFKKLDTTRAFSSGVTVHVA